MAVNRSSSDDPPRSDAEQEALLVERARCRDTAAFRELVDRHRDHAYAVAFRVLRSSADAEEVAQDAFVRAWAALPGFRGESRFGTWLHAITLRRALDRAATLKTRAARETAIDTVEHSGFADPERGHAERIGLSMRLGKLIEGLSDMQRSAVMMFYFEQRSVDEIAAALRIPTGTVKTHLSRARAALRGAWESTGESPRESGGAS